MKLTFPKWKVNGNENLVNLCTNFYNNEEAIDLLTQMMQLEPSKRISVKSASISIKLTLYRTSVQQVRAILNRPNSCNFFNSVSAPFSP